VDPRHFYGIKKELTPGLDAVVTACKKWSTGETLVADDAIALETAIKNAV